MEKHVKLHNTLEVSGIITLDITSNWNQALKFESMSSRHTVELVKPDKHTTKFKGHKYSKD